MHTTTGNIDNATSKNFIFANTARARIIFHPCHHLAAQCFCSSGAPRNHPARSRHVTSCHNCIASCSRARELSIRRITRRRTFDFEEGPEAGAQRTVQLGRGEGIGLTQCHASSCARRATQGHLGRLSWRRQRRARAAAAAADHHHATIGTRR